jgi:hypothetical protein
MIELLSEKIRNHADEIGLKPGCIISDNIYILEDPLGGNHSAHYRYHAWVLNEYNHFEHVAAEDSFPPLFDAIERFIREILIEPRII